VLVIEVRSSQQDDLGSNHFVIRYGVFRYVLNERLLLCTGKRDYEGAFARHFAFLLYELAKYRLTRLKSRQNVRPKLRKPVLSCRFSHFRVSLDLIYFDRKT